MSDILLRRHEQDKQLVKKPNESIAYALGKCFDKFYRTNRISSKNRVFILGGSYVQIESEWKEIVKAKTNKNKGKSSYAELFFFEKTIPITKMSSQYKKFIEKTQQTMYTVHILFTKM